MGRIGVRSGYRLCCTSIRTIWCWTGTLWPRTRSQGTAVSGKDLYNRECESCHREDRTGAPPAIPSLVDVAKQMTVAEVRSVVFYGSGRMPGFPTLAPDYTNAIVLVRPEMV